MKPPLSWTLLLTGCQVGIRQWALCIQGAHCRIPNILIANSLEPGMLIPYCSCSLKWGDWRMRNIGVRSANPLTLDGFYRLLLWTAYTIGPISADQQIQIGIRGGARSFQLRGYSIKQNENFEKSQECKDRSEKLKNQWRFLVGA
jgi:hypothetical protein